MDSMQWLNNARIMQGWQTESLLGQGRHSTVWAIRRGEEKAALKVIRVTPEEGEVASCGRRGLTEQGLAELYRAKLEKCCEEVRIMQLLQGESGFVSYQDHEVIHAADGFGGMILVRMERLTSLRSYVKEHGVSQAFVTQMAGSIAGALDICHRGTKCAAFVHGDVKIDNIYYSREKVFKLGDFGLSAPPDGSMSLSGTQGYTAPEAIQTGKQPTGDMYALGMTMYILLNRMETPVREGTKDLPRPEDCSSDALWQTILRMTSCAPEQRYQDMQQVLAALSAIDVSDPQMQAVRPQGIGAAADAACTLTDTMARHVLQAQVPARAPGADVPRQKPVEKGADASAVSRELETSFHEEQQQARRKRSRKLWIAACAAALLLLAGAGLLALMTGGRLAAKEVSMTAALDPQGRLVIDVADNAQEHLLWIRCGEGTVQETVRQLAGDQQEISFAQLASPHARLLLQIGKECHLTISHLPPDAVCEVSLVNADSGQPVLSGTVTVPAATEAEASGRVHTLWYCLQTDMEAWPDRTENPYIALRREELLLRVRDDLALPSVRALAEERAWLMNVTFVGNVDASASYTLLQRCNGGIVAFCPLDASQVWQLDDNRLTLCLPEAVVRSGAGRAGEAFTLQLLLDGKEAYAYTGQYEGGD